MASKLEKSLATLGLGAFLPAFRREKIDDSLLTGLTDSDLREIGLLKLGDRKRLLAAFADVSVTGDDVESSDPSAAPVVPDQPPVVAPKQEKKVEGRFTTDPAQASRACPFINSLGLSFVPIPRSKTLFCTWLARIQDYEQFCHETAVPVPTADFPQGRDHPVVNAWWTDAHLFCDWLTKRDAWLGLITAKYVYRLPRDDEWSAAVGLPQESGLSPKARSGVMEGFPWGPDFPPPPGAGNYHQRLGVDPYSETSPVGCFNPNKSGIFDLGGNVWEWCMDEYEKGSGLRTLRGGSCFNDDPEFLMSSFRDKCQPDRGRNNVGIRVVLTAQADRDPWYKA
ncbi:MAG: SUMF1/EgtB/PvdO family nonheme iron enzyme [Terrimicrobiaceae bacterium]